MSERAKFEVLVCEVRADGLWPVVRLADEEAGAAVPMTVRSGRKAAGLAVMPLRRALTGLLRTEAAVRLREEMAEVMREGVMREGVMREPGAEVTQFPGGGGTVGDARLSPLPAAAGDSTNEGGDGL